MQSHRIVPAVEKAMQGNLSTTPEDCRKIINQGTQALVASDFLERIIRITRGEAAMDAVKFIEANICKHTYIASDSLTLRFFDLTQDMDAEGVEMEVDVSKKVIYFRRMSGLYGVSTTTWQEEKKYG